MKKTLYNNGTIVTMNEKEEIVESVLVENGIIKFVGKFQDVKGLIDDSTEVVDLKGTSMLPGFLDPHSHFLAYVPAFGYCNIAPAPTGKVNTIDDLKNAIKAYIIEKNIPKGGWVVAMGYDTMGFEDQRHPNKFDLDDISSDHYIIAAHASNHLGVINSKVIEHMGLNENSQNPSGGAYGRIKGTNEISGYMEETAFMLEVMPIFPKLETEQLMDNFVELQKFYASFGITTTQDGMLNKARLDMVKEADKRGILKLDVVVYPGKMEVENGMLKENPASVDYAGKHYRMGGVKLFLDGSPQGKTAWVTKPYENEDNSGYPIYTDEVVYDYCKMAIENEHQLLSHVNGDAAIDQLLNMYEKAKKDLNSTADLRPVAVHSQITRDDQIDRYKALGMMPSYFVDHTFFWGDTHIQNLGEERAFRISPLKTTKDKGVKFTLHQDTPVVPPNMIRTINSAVNRVTKTGVSIGEKEKVTIYDALKAITIDSAYQYHEENKKGSIEVGKLADFVVLDRNPLAITNDEILDINVLTTIKDDNVIFSK